MRAVRRPVPLILLAGALSVASVALAQNGGLASRAYDGDWRVAVTTTVGNCAPSADVVVTVKNAKIVAVDAGGVETWGYVDATNTVVARFSQGERAMRANGSVRGGVASGAWSANTDYCGGRWTASRVK